VGRRADASADQNARGRLILPGRAAIAGQASTCGGPATGLISIGIQIGVPPGPCDDDAFAAMAYARSWLSHSTIQKPMRNSLH
jgi:hypothetical protein